MTAQQIMQDSHLTRIRTLRDEVARLKAELAHVREERDSLRKHFALALLAAQDAERLENGGTLLIVDGWNAILGSVRLQGLTPRVPAVTTTPADKPARSSSGWRKQLVDAVQKWLDGRPKSHAWIVFDGSRANGETKGRLRVSYTGGSGEHRADRLVCDYLRMRQYNGSKGHVIVVTNDKEFRSDAQRFGAEVTGIEELNGNLVMAITRERIWIKK